MTFIDQFRAARRASTPIIGISTPDPASTIKLIQGCFLKEPPALLQWDIVRGVSAINEAGKALIDQLGLEPSTTTNPVDFLGRAKDELPAKTILFMHNAHRVLAEQGVSQAIWNVRDAFKADKRTVVLLSPGLKLPVELQQDVVLIDEPLPTNEQIGEIVREAFKSGGLEAPDESTVTKAVDALCGLAAFPAEQAACMSISPEGLNLEDLWERKRKIIEGTPGLSVWRGGETFEAIGGCENAKSFMTQILAGVDPPRAIVFMDEIEKQLAGNGTDTSGVTTELVGQLLTFMQDKEATGVILIGPPGAAKSAIAKATGNSGGIPTIQFDVGASKGSLVGESGANMRQALKVIESVSQGRALFIATCNSIGVLPPELRRRFRFGTFFFDLPTQTEREQIWKIYCKKSGIGGECPEDEGWTGAEIRQCVDIARRLKCKLIEAAAYIVPVARSAAEQIERLRVQASGKFISASAPGVYRYEKAAAAPAGRSIGMEE